MAILAAVAGVSCGHQQARSVAAGQRQDPARTNTTSHGIERDLLILLDGARDVYWSQHDGARYLTYKASLEYPARGAIDRIGTLLKEHGWARRAEDVFNPASKLANIDEWGYFVDATTEPNVGIRGWQGQWEDAHGAIVIYDLRYRRPPEGTARMNELEVTAIYMPKEAVLATIKEGEGARRQYGLPPQK